MLFIYLFFIFIYLFGVFIKIFKGMILLCNPGWPWTHCGVWADLTTEPTDSASQVLGSQLYATTNIFASSLERGSICHLRWFRCSTQPPLTPKLFSFHLRTPETSKSPFPLCPSSSHALTPEDFTRASESWQDFPFCAWLVSLSVMSSGLTQGWRASEF